MNEYTSSTYLNVVKYVHENAFFSDIAVICSLTTTLIFAILLSCKSDPSVLFQISGAQNRVYLNAGTLMLNINDDDYEAGLKSINKATGVEGKKGWL